MSMTGRNYGHGYRYTVTETGTRTGQGRADAEVGALDAPACIPAGGHFNAWWLAGNPCTSELVRVSRRPVCSPIQDYRP